MKEGEVVEQAVVGALGVNDRVLLVEGVIWDGLPLLLTPELGDLCEAEEDALPAPALEGLAL